MTPRCAAAAVVSAVVLRRPTKEYTHRYSMMHRRLTTAGIEVAPHYHQLMVGCKFVEYARTGKKRKGRDRKNRGAGGVGFLVKEYLCDIIEVINYKIRRKHMDEGTRGAGSEIFFLRKHLYASRVEEYGKIDTEEVRRGSRRCTEL